MKGSLKERGLNLELKMKSILGSSSAQHMVFAGVVIGRHTFMSAEPHPQHRISIVNRSIVDADKIKLLSFNMYNIAMFYI